MRSTFYGLEIAKSGLFSAQTALELTGHNTSNVDTPGYTRQRLNTAPVPPATGHTFIGVNNRTTSGRGTTTLHIEQVRNSFLDYQYRKENTTTAKWQMKEQYFGYVESLFNNELEAMDNSNGISSMFSQFYDALYELQENPEKTEIRVNVQENAKTLCETMNYYSMRLQEQQTTLNESVKMTVNSINSYAEQIAVLNDQIFAFELDGSKANDLRDQRNLLLDNLSELVNIETMEDANGQLIVQVDGKNLVRHVTTTKMAITEDTEFTLYNGDARYMVAWADREGNPTMAEVNVTNGALRAYMEVRDGKTGTGGETKNSTADVQDGVGINYVIDQLDKLCQKIAKDMNEVHEKGWTIPSDGHPESRTGIKFFNVPQKVNEFGNPVYDEKGNPVYDYSAITASNFRLSDDILSDPFNIAASDSEISADGETNEQKGNGRIALELCHLISKKDDAGNPDNIDSVYKTLLNALSIEQSYISNTYDSQEVMREHLDEQRSSIMDVSLDEEMTNVVRYGHAYNACSRVISAIDEELDKLINGTGRVGL